MPEKRKAPHVLLTAAAGLLASLFALRMGETFAALKLPFLFPPVWLLPAGWTGALICLVSAAGAAGKRKVVNSFYVSLGLIICWAVLFFRLDAILAALVSGLLLTGVWLHMRRLLGDISPKAKKLMLCCCVWSGYLTYLNAGIWIMN